MSEFNPITDLMPMSSPRENDGGSADQIEFIKTKLTETNNGVINIISILKSKNSLLDRDLDKIKSLNNRLRRTIPRIPSMPGVAGVQFSELTESRKKRGGGFTLPRLPFLLGLPKRKPKTKTTYTRPKLAKNLQKVSRIKDRVLMGSLLTRTPVAANNIKKLVKEGSKVSKQLQRQSKKFNKTIVKDVNKFLFGEKTIKKKPRVLKEPPIIPQSKEGFVKIEGAKVLKREQLKNKAENIIEDIVFPKGKITTLDRKNVSSFIRGVRNAKNQGNFDEVAAEADLFLKTIKNERLIQLGKLTQGSKKFKDVQNSIKEIDRGIIKINDMRLKAIENAATVTAGGKIAEEQVKRQQRVIKKRFSEPLSDDVKVNEDTFKNFQKQLKQYKQFDKQSSINTTPLSNDIASLNIDTGVTNTVIIITDSPVA